MHEDSHLAPIVAIGGLLTVKQLAEWYRPVLSKDKASVLPAHKRFIAPPQRGLGKVEEMRDQLVEQLEGVYERLGSKKLFLVGHSLGGLMATMTAVERPDMVAGVASLGGVHTGYRLKTPGTELLRHFVGNPPEAKLLRHDSDFMQEHKHRMATEWPKDVPLHVISTPLDILVVPPQGFDVKLAHGEPDNRLILPHVPHPHIGGILAGAARFALRIPHDFKPLHTGYLTEHLNIPRNPDVADHIDQSRRALAGEFGSVTLGATASAGRLAVAAA
jgi:pimeloyl-ACP methyl ester carboxylesterase